MPRKFFILAGEASGDSHAARLITALKAADPESRFIGMGGRRMQAAGLEVARDLEGMQVVGFWEVAKKYGFFKRVFYQLLDRLKQERPDALICIDYPGFNVRFAMEARKIGIPVIYYIVPQVWAWKPGRAKTIARCVDRAFCVFDFEPPFFEKFGLKTEFVGHPLMDGQEARPERVRLRRLLLPEDRPHVNLVGLFPGSRANEIRHHLAPMTDAVQHERFKGTTLGWINLPPDAPMKIEPRMEAAAGGFYENLTPAGMSADQFQSILPRGIDESPCRLPVLAAATDFNVVKSGTSTLEAGLAGTPMCALYKGSALSYTLAHLMVNIPVFSLVNIVLGRYVVPELLQGEVNANKLAEQINTGLFDEKFREQQRAALAELPKKLGGPGASARAAQGILNFLNGKK